MKTLPLTFNKDGFSYAQVDRTPKAAIYSQSQDGKIVAYEVIQIRVRGAREAFGTQFPEGEVYPAASEWGLCGWTYSGNLALDQAMATYEWVDGGKVGPRPSYADAVSRSNVAA